MFIRSYHLATLRRCMALASSAMLSACALRGVEPPLVNAVPETTPTTGAVREGYVVDVPAFALITSSSSAKAIALTSLHEAVTTFEWLFENPAPHIGVVAVDGSMSPPAATSMMPQDLTTIMVMTGEPDPADPARSVAELESALRTMSADAWLHDYANQWAVAVDPDTASNGAEMDEVMSRADVLPHWLRVGALRIIAAGKQPTRSDAPARLIMPLRDLLHYKLRPAEVGVVGQMLHHPERINEPRMDEAYNEAIARAFILQSASVVRFLRETQGGAAVSDLFGATMTGMPAEEILSQLPHPTSVAALERSSLRWSSTHDQIAAAR